MENLPENIADIFTGNDTFEDRKVSYATVPGLSATNEL
jgi:hypothetical protein